MLTQCRYKSCTLAISRKQPQEQERIAYALCLRGDHVAFRATQTLIAFKAQLTSKGSDTGSIIQSQCFAKPWCRRPRALYSTCNTQKPARWTEQACSAWRCEGQINTAGTVSQPVSHSRPPTYILHLDGRQSIPCSCSTGCSYTTAAAADRPHMTTRKPTAAYYDSHNTRPVCTSVKHSAPHDVSK